MDTTASHSYRGGVKKALFALLLPLLLFLTACEYNTHIKFHENETADIDMELMLSADDLGATQAPANLGCDLLSRTNDPEGPDFTIEDRSADGNLHCISTAKAQPLKKATPGSDGSITNEDGVYTLTSEALPTDSAEGLQELGITPKINMVFEFPGDVIESSIGKVEGNKVIVTEFNQLQQPLNIKAKSTAGGSNMLLWVLIGVGVLVLALILWLVLRKKGPQDGGQPQQFQQPPQGQPPHGQHPQQGQPPQDPQNPDQR